MAVANAALSMRDMMNVSVGEERNAGTMTVTVPSGEAPLFGMASTLGTQAIAYATDYPLFIAERPEVVRIQEGSIKFNISKMDLGHFYPVELQGRLYVLRKVKEGVVDIYELVD